IKDVCSEYEIMISDFSLNNFAIHASIAMRRCTFYNYVIVNEEKIADLRNTIEFRAADTFVKLLEKEFNCMLPVGETVYYAMHLQSKSIYDEVILNNEDSIKIKKCISILLSEIKSNFELDFDQDQELYDYLYMHIPQMILRLKNHMVIRNPLVYDNLRRYLFATKVTHSACAVIENFYNVEVDINEFGYLVLYFNLAISKFENRRKIRIGIICGRGRPESIMYYNEICENFSASRYEVIKLENTNTNEIIFNSIDFLISTYELPKNKIPTYIIRNDFYIEEIRKAVNDYQYHTIDIGKYFNHDNSYFHMEGTTKEEVLQNLYKLLYTKDLLKSIPDETNGFKSDELGNGIVHFQDIYRLLRKSLCFVVVLQHPILWNQDIVRVLIITKTKKEGDKDLPALCRIVSRWSNRIDKVEHLIATQDYNIFLKDIMEV
ncbi:MAG: PRD domain-containing protein, partial [Bacilli bacterium]